jgi:hypothetical protein
VPIVLTLGTIGLALLFGGALLVERRVLKADSRLDTGLKMFGVMTMIGACVSAPVLVVSVIVVALL